MSSQRQESYYNTPNPKALKFSPGAREAATFKGKSSQKSFLSSYPPPPQRVFSGSQPAASSEAHHIKRSNNAFTHSVNSATRTRPGEGIVPNIPALQPYVVSRLDQSSPMNVDCLRHKRHFVSLVNQHYNRNELGDAVGQNSKAVLGAWDKSQKYELYNGNTYLTSGDIGQASNIHSKSTGWKSNSSTSSAITASTAINANNYSFHYHNICTPPSALSTAALLGHAKVPVPYNSKPPPPTPGSKALLNPSVRPLTSNAIHAREENRKCTRLEIYGYGSIPICSQYGWEGPPRER
eukprot:Nk52_evm26s2462 gene=Nk52_evmTU26s2462